MEREQAPIIETQKPLTAEQKFTQILGKPHIPEHPSNTLDELKLPAEMLGRLEQSILQGQKEHKERGQLIFWDLNQQKVEPGQVTVSKKPNEVTHKRPLPRLFSKALLEAHTHFHDPKELGQRETIPSEDDLISYILYPNRSYMFAVGSEVGISLLVQTQEIAKKSFLSQYWDKPSLRRELQDYIRKNQDLLLSSPLAVGRFLERYGYSYYLWRPPEGTIKEGDLQKGITFSRIAMDSPAIFGRKDL